MRAHGATVQAAGVFSNAGELSRWPLPCGQETRPQNAVQAQSEIKSGSIARRWLAIRLKGNWALPKKPAH